MSHKESLAMSNEFLNQNEIDALLRNGGSEDANTLSEIEQDALAEIGNISMGSAATALSTLINRKVTITVPDVSMKTLSQIKEDYPIPCITVNIQYMSGLKGENLLVIKEQDASVIGDLMMGGDGIDVPDEIGEIELSAVTEAMNMMMGSAATSMSDLFNYLIDISPPETQRRNLATDALEFQQDDRIYTVIAFRIEIQDLVDSTMLQIIDVDFAKEMVGQLLKEQEFEIATAEVAATAVMEQESVATYVPTDLAGQTDSAKAETSITASAPALGNLNIELIKDIPVHVRAVLGKTRMSIDHILKLGPGNIMELDTIEGEPIDIYANDALIAKGEVVIVGEQFGVRITEISTQSNRIKSIS